MSRGLFEPIALFRTVAACLVSVGLIAGQWLAVPHAHGQGSDASHDAASSRPHFHLGWLCKSNSHQSHQHHHGQSHGGHHPHGDHGHDHGHPDPKSNPDRPDSSPVGDEHDADAVFCGNDVLCTGTTTVADMEVPSTALATIFAICESSDSDGSGNLAERRSDHFSGSHCALYLALRTLRN